MKLEELTRWVSEEDLVLLDSSILSIGPIAQQTYEIHHFLGFGTIAEELKLANRYWCWLLREIIPQPQVKTIPEVLDETRQLKNHLEECYSFHLIQKKQAKKRYRRQHRNGNALLVQRLNYIKECLRNEVQHDAIARKKAKMPEEKASTRQQNDGLNLLNLTWYYVTKIINGIHTYDGERLIIEKKSELISETDYQLIAAGVGHLFSHPQHRVSVLTKDHHLILALHQAMAFLPMYVPSTSTGQITVYYFHSYGSKNALDLDLRSAKTYSLKEGSREELEAKIDGCVSKQSTY